MAHVPPTVQSLTATGRAYLLAWERLEDGTWAAQIAWIEVDGETWRGRTARVTPEDITQLDDQDYTQVPRRTP